MGKLFSLLEFAAELHSIDRNLKNLGPDIVEAACVIICTEAKKRIGVDHADWPALAPATIADRVRKGFTPNEPGLRTGAMRDSIGYTLSSTGLEGQVGSNDQNLVYFELGTSKQPPRSVLAAAAAAQEKKIQTMAARAVVAALAGHGLHSSEFFELLHLLKHTAEYFKEQVIDPLLHPEDNKEKRK